MDYISLTSLLLRLTGVVIMAASAVSVPGTFVSLYLRDVGGGGVNAETWLLTAIAATFPIVIGLLLIYFPARVANKLVAGDGEAADAQRLDAQHLEQIAFSILGLYFIAMAMFDAVYWCAKLRLYPIYPRRLGPQRSPTSPVVGPRFRRRCADRCTVRHRRAVIVWRPRSRQSPPPAANAAGPAGRGAVANARCRGRSNPRVTASNKRDSVYL